MRRWCGVLCHCEIHFSAHQSPRHKDQILQSRTSDGPRSLAFFRNSGFHSRTSPPVIDIKVKDLRRTFDSPTLAEFLMSRLGYGICRSSGTRHGDVRANLLADKQRNSSGLAGILYIV